MFCCSAALGSRGVTLPDVAPSRHQRYLRLEEALDAEAAATLMEHLPPVGWADIALKRDLDALEHRLDLRSEDFEYKL